MSLIKNVKNRIIMFLVGIVFTAVGGIMIYYEFFEKKYYHVDNSYYAYAIFIIGIVALIMAFEKKKKLPDESKNIQPNSPDKDQKTGP